jgi:hypothetical protein
MINRDIERDKSKPNQNWVLIYPFLNLIPVVITVYF